MRIPDSVKEAGEPLDLDLVLRPLSSRDGRVGISLIKKVAPVNSELDAILRERVIDDAVIPKRGFNDLCGHSLLARVKFEKLPNIRHLKMRLTLCDQNIAYFDQSRVRH